MVFGANELTQIILVAAIASVILSSGMCLSIPKK